MKLTRLSLLVLLLPLLVLCYFLIQSPLCYTRGYLTLGWLNEERTIACFLTQSNIGLMSSGTTRQWGQLWAIDLATGKLTRLPEDQFVASKFFPRIQSRAITRLDNMDAYWNSQIKNWQLQELDPQTQKFVPGRVFEFLLQGELVGNRFMVGIDGQQILSLDLDDPNAAIKTLLAANGSGRNEFLPIPNSSKFYRFNSASGVAVNPKLPAPILAELFEIDSTGTPKLLNSWQVEKVLRRFPPTAVVGELIVSVASNPYRIEFHNLSDGQLNSSEPLPKEFDLSNTPPSNLNILINHLFFTHQDGTSIYHLKRREWSQLPGEEYFVMDEKNDNNILLLLRQDKLENGKFEVYDCSAKQRLGTIERRDGVFYELIDRETIAEISVNDGFSVGILNFRTNEFVKRWRPLWWVVPATVILLIGYALWAIAWMIVSARAGSSPWLDGMLVGGLFVGALALRMLAVGGAPCFMRLPNWFGFGIFTAALMLAESYFVFGKSRLVLRVMPGLLVLATLLATVSLIYKTDPRWAWFGLTTMFIPVSFMLCVCILIRLLGWRPKCDPSLSLDIRGTQDNNTIPSSSSPHLVDLFVLITCIGAVVAAVRPILLSWGHSWQALTVYYESFGIVGFGLLVGIFALSRWRIAFIAGCMIAGLSYIYVMIPPLMDFTFHGSGISLQMAIGAANRGTTIEAMLSAITAFFALIVPFRLRGWRLT